MECGGFRLSNLKPARWERPRCCNALQPRRKNPWEANQAAPRVLIIVMGRLRLRLPISFVTSQQKNLRCRSDEPSGGVVSHLLPHRPHPPLEDSLGSALSISTIRAVRYAIRITADGFLRREGPHIASPQASAKSNTSSLRSNSDSSFEPATAS